MDSPNKPTILIAGGGIAGLGLALFLSQSDKYSVRVFERSKAVVAGVGGHYGLNGALECLDRAGFHDLWVPLCHQIEQMQVRWHGNMIKFNVDVAKILHHSNFEDKFGAFRRDEFQLALAERLPAGILECDKEILSIHDTGRVVRVEFTDGTVAEGDILVGADGINSSVRKHIFPEINKMYSGVKLWWMISDEPAPQHLKHRIVELHDKDAMVLCFSVGAQGKQVVILAKHAPEPTQEDLENNGSLDFLHQLFQHHSVYEEGLVTEDTLRKSRLIHTGVYNLPPSIPQWHKGRICLLGDAIHATTPFMGQGANQAMQSAFCLARLLKERGGSEYEDIFMQYHAIREPVTAKIIENSAASGRLRIPMQNESCFSGIRRFLLLSFPSLFPEKFRKMLLKQISITV
jgi:2-polyprenyl-6-methoxyphenol hydroxylase-like FAD-dependent oxidoreductase